MASGTDSGAGMSVRDPESVDMDDLEAYGGWLKPEATEESRLAGESDDEEELLGSFSAIDERTRPEEAGRHLPETPSFIADIGLYAESATDDSGTRFQGNGSSVPGTSGDDSGSPDGSAPIREDFEFDSGDDDALDDDFVLGAADRPPAAGTVYDYSSEQPEKQAARDTPADGKVPEGTGPASDGETGEIDESDEISEEFFEIDEEIGDQESAPRGIREQATGSPGNSGSTDRADERIPSPDPVPAPTEAGITIPAGLSSGDTRRTPASVAETARMPFTRELSTDLLTKIAGELSSIRGELIGIKRSFSSDSVITHTVVYGSRETAGIPPVQANGDAGSARKPDEHPPSDEGSGGRSETAESTAPSGIDRPETLPGTTTDRDDTPRDGFMDEVRTMFIYLDSLLESLPETKIEEFARSPHFDSYKRIFETLRIG